jgi:hypothetical protein
MGRSRCMMKDDKRTQDVDGGFLQVPMIVYGVIYII